VSFHLEAHVIFIADKRKTQQGARSSSSSPIFTIIAVAYSNPQRAPRELVRVIKKCFVFSSVVYTEASLSPALLR